METNQAEVSNKTICKLDPKASRLTVRASAAGLLSSFGHNPVFIARDLEGEVGFVPDQIETASLRVKVKAESLEVTNQDLSSKDQKEIEQSMKKEVLETSRYPEIVFESTAVTGEKVFEGQYRVNIQGNLALHGVTRQQAVPANVRLIGDTIRAHGEFTVRQSDFRIQPVSAIGGALKVKDELRISFEFVGKP